MLDLLKTVNFLRRAGTGQDTIFLILGLIEIDAIQTPFFSGVDGKDLLVSLLDVIKEYTERFNESKVYEPDDFLMFLAMFDKLKFNSDDLCALIAEIKQQGEENYGFKKFERVGQTDAGHGEVKANG